MKWVLARWVLDAGFLPFLQPVLRFMVPMGVIWHAWCLYFGVLGDPGTILERSWDIGGHKEGACGVQAWIFIDFGWISGPHFDSFSGTLDQNRYLFSCLFPGDFLKRFWGMNLDFWGFKNKHLVWEGLQLSTFHRIWNSADFRIDF